MARTPQAVRELLMAVWEPALAAGRGRCGEADRDAAFGRRERRAGSRGIWRYLSEKRRLAEHDLDEAELKPYFQARRDDPGRPSDCANRLFGL